MMETQRTFAWLLALSATALPAQDPDLFELLESNRRSEWKVLGPFSSRDRQGLETAFFDETAAPDFDAEHETEDGHRIRWRTPEVDLRDGQPHDTLQFGAGDWDTIYLARTITAEADHEPVLALGMDDSLAVWVNGEEVFRKKSNQAVGADQELVKIALVKGDNRVLLKVVNNMGGMGFYFNLTDRTDTHGRWGAGHEGDGFDQYELSTVPVPESLKMEVGGLAFEPGGSLLVCTRRGAIYRVHDPDANDPDELRITTFADGLHEPLGMLLEDDGSVLVAQKPELTRVADRDGDGRADEFETIAQPWGLSGNYHEYHFGPVRDGQGNLWATLNIGFPSGDGPRRLYRGSAYRITPSGKFEITCYGLRSPNGLVANDAGDVFYTDNQGEWMDVCRLAHLQPKKFYGHQVPVQWAEKMPEFGWETERTLPAVWFPYHLMRSTSEPVVDRTGGKFGPYAGQMIIGDQNNALLVRTTLEKVNGVYQGACYPFWQGFACGVNRLAFDDDGVLYVGLTERGWGSVGPKSFGLQRLRFKGSTPFDLLEVKATAKGFDLYFTKPLAADLRVTNKRIRIREYGYRYWSTYGSGEFDSRPIEVVSVDVSADRRRISVVTGERQTGKAFQIELRGDFRSADGERPIAREAFYTLLEIP